MTGKAERFTEGPPLIEITHTVLLRRATKNVYVNISNHVGEPRRPNLEPPTASNCAWVVDGREFMQMLSQDHREGGRGGHRGAEELGNLRATTSRNTGAFVRAT